jgi:hypothetical protein
MKEQQKHQANQFADLKNSTYNDTMEESSSPTSMKGFDSQQVNLDKIGTL